MMSGVYHANFRCSDPRPGRQQKSFLFGAASDGVAAAVAAEFGNWTTGQLTSLTANRGGVGSQTSYPGGTRYTANVIMSDSSINIWRQSFRNVAAPAAGDSREAAIAAAFAGTAYIGTVFSVAALSAPPALCNSGNVVAVVNDVSIVTKY